jgi:hypothetical protein
MDVDVTTLHGRRAEFADRVSEVFDRAGLRAGVTIPIGGPVPQGSRAFAEWIADRPTRSI